MLTCLVGLWMAATMAQQAPSEVAWLKSVPADVPVVVRIRALEDVGGELQAMLKAMSPFAADAAKDGLDEGLRSLKAMFGKAVGKNPFLLLSGLPDPEAFAIPPWGMIVKSVDYEGVVKGLAEDGGGKPKSLGGHDSFTSKDGQTWYATRGDDWVAFGPDEAMIKAIRKPEVSLDDMLSAEAKAKLLQGDVSLYLNVVAIQKRYGAAIQKQVKTALVAQMREDNQPGPELTQSMKSINTLFAGLDKALKAGGVLVLGFDFDADGLKLAGWAAAKGAVPSAKGAAKPEVNTGTLLEKLPDDLMVYFFSAASSQDAPNPTDAVGGLSGLFKRRISPHEKATAARSKALEGRQVTGFSLVPLRSVSLADPTDPNAVARASLQADRASRSDEHTVITVEPDALKYGGYPLDRTKSVFSERLIQLIQKEKPSFPNIVGIVQKIVPDRTIVAYFGSDGKDFISLVLASEEQVRAAIDVVRNARRNLGRLAAWKSLRGQFPKEMTLFMAINGQETVATILQIYGVLSNNADMKPPADMPGETQFLGIGAIASSQGYDFRLVIPSKFIPVLEKGLAPLGDGP